MAIVGGNTILGYSALQLGKKNNGATMADLRSINKVMKKKEGRK